MRLEADDAARRSHDLAGRHGVEADIGADVEEHRSGLQCALPEAEHMQVALAEHRAMNDDTLFGGVVKTRPSQAANSNRPPWPLLWPAVRPR